MCLLSECFMLKYGRVLLDCLEKLMPSSSDGVIVCTFPYEGHVTTCKCRGSYNLKMTC